MKRLTIISFILISGLWCYGAYSQSTLSSAAMIEKPTRSNEDTLSSNQLTHRNGIRYRDNEPFTGMVMDHYDNGPLKFTGRYQDGLLHGVALVYHDNGQLQDEKPFKAGKIHGTWKTWYSSGKAESIRSYSDGEMHGPTIFWDRAGAKTLESNYHWGKKSGRATQWYGAGRMARELYYNQGLREGKETRWSKDGSKYSEVWWKNNKRDSIATLWDSSGRIVMQEYFEAGKKIKRIKWDGQTKRVMTWKDKAAERSRSVKILEALEVTRFSGPKESIYQHLVVEVKGKVHVKHIVYCLEDIHIGSKVPGYTGCSCYKIMDPPEAVELTQSGKDTLIISNYPYGRSKDEILLPLKFETSACDQYYLLNGEAELHVEVKGEPEVVVFQFEPATHPVINRMR